MNILVVGAGMYVTGRGSNGSGTVLPALAELSKNYNINAVTVCATKDDNKQIVEKCRDEINSLLKTNLRIIYKNIINIWESLEISKFDCAIVCVPDHLHYKISSFLLENEVHTQIVKPLSPTIEEAKALIKIQKERNVHACVEFHKRFDESNLVVKRLIQSGELGEISYFNVHYSQRKEIPLSIFKNWAEKTNIFQYLGVHYIDLIYFLTRFTPRRVMAIGNKSFLKKKRIDTFDSVHAIIEWQNLNIDNNIFHSIFSTNWIDPNSTTAMSDQRYNIIGSRGRINCDQKNRGLEFISKERAQQINPYFSTFLDSNEDETTFSGYGLKSIEQFISDVENIINGKLKPKQLETKRPSLKEALISTAVIENVNLSLEKNSKWIVIDD